MSEQAQQADQGNTAQSAQGDGQAQASLLSGEATANPQSTEASASDAASNSTEAKPSEGEKKPEEADKAEGAPEKYDFKAPEGFEIDASLTETFEPLARELNLSNEKANKLITEMMPKVSQRFMEVQQAAWTKQLETWVGDVKADKELGGEVHGEALTIANRALTRFATPELLAVLGMPSKENPKGMGLGNHPELVRVFYRIGKASADDSLVTSSTSASGSQKSTAEILFGGSSSN